jgi:hypothetical protein
MKRAAMLFGLFAGARRVPGRRSKPVSWGECRWRSNSQLSGASQRRGVGYLQAGGHESQTSPGTKPETSSGSKPESESESELRPRLESEPRAESEPGTQSRSGAAVEEAKRSQAIAQLPQHVADTDVTANAMRRATQAAFGQDQLIRDVQTFRNPQTGDTFELSNLHDHACLGGNNEYLMSDDPNFNPNGQLNENWTSLQPVRPQP